MTKEEHRVIQRLAVYIRGLHTHEDVDSYPESYSYVKLVDFAEWLEGNCQGKFPIERRSQTDWE